MSCRITAVVAMADAGTAWLELSPVACATAKPTNVKLIQCYAGNTAVSMIVVDIEDLIRALRAVQESR